MEFKTVIGLEIHAQLKTKSKMFCGCDNKADEAKPNSLVCPVCLGLPGVLPVPNKLAIEWVLKTGIALNCKIADYSKFDRKHYFYPDLPKNYQISQFDLPFCLKGSFELDSEGQSKKIGITRIHLEEDAGKLIHSKDASLVDFNRAGTPLMEIVTEPDISSPQEAKVFMQELRSILRYLQVSDADMEKGHLRCDANISINQKDQKLGVPVEIKNLNSFKMVERSLLYEEKRQRELLEKKEKIIKETRGWDDSKGITYSQRSKEQAQDYRYFPEPDIPPFELKEFDLEKLKQEIPELPALKRERYISDLKQEKDYLSNVHDVAIETLIKEPILEDYYLYFAEKGLDKLFALMFVTHQMWGKLATGTTPDQFHKKEIFDILKDWWDKKITNLKAKEIFELSLKTPEKVVIALRESEIKLVGNELEKIIEKVIKENDQAIQDIKKGKETALRFLVGQVMRETKGQANPQIVNNLLKEKIERK